MAQTEIDRPADELILQHLGAAVMLCWKKLPPYSQGIILEQADDLIGITPVTGIKHHIFDLLSRRSKS
jgi:hypothetical protein